MSQLTRDVIGMTRMIFREAWFISWPILLVFAWALIAGVTEARVDANCLALGYPNSSVTWSLVGYCHRRVNQTDEVLRLK